MQRKFSRLKALKNKIEIKKAGLEIIKPGEPGLIFNSVVSD